MIISLIIINWLTRQILNKNEKWHEKKFILIIINIIVEDCLFMKFVELTRFYNKLFKLKYPYVTCTIFSFF